jgi:hypothetical protein
MKINACFLLVKNTTKFLITGILLSPKKKTVQSKLKNRKN